MVGAGSGGDSAVIVQVLKMLQVFTKLQCKSYDVASTFDIAIIYDIYESYAGSGELG